MGGAETSQKEWLRGSEYEAFGYARVLPLANALRGPQEVPDLLLFEPKVGKEDSEVELLEEGVAAQCRLLFKENAVQIERRVAPGGLRLRKELAIDGIAAKHLLDPFEVPTGGELLLAVRVQQPEGR